MRLIDADALKYKQQVMYKKDDSDDVWAEWFTTATEIANAPTIDAEPVVRCRDCVWWTKQEASCQGRCARLGIYPTGAWYCANGERKDNG